MANAGTRKLLRAPINPTRVAVIDERGLAGQTYAELAAALELTAADPETLAGAIAADEAASAALMPGFVRHPGGTADAWATIDAALTARGRAILEPGKTYYVSRAVVLEDEERLNLNGSTLVARDGFTILGGDAVVLIKHDDGTQPAWHCRVTGGRIDGRFLVTSGIDVAFARECDLDFLKIANVKKYGVYAGSDVNYATTGIHCTNVHAWFHEEYSPVSGYEVNASDSVGIYHNYNGNVAETDKFGTTDSYVRGCFAIGFRTGFRADGYSIEYAQCHAWSRRAHGPMEAGFKTGSRSATIKHAQCYADTPHNWKWDTGTSAYVQDGTITEVYGFDIDGFSLYLVQSKVFINPDELYGGTDGLVVPVRIRKSGGAYGYMIGMRVDGGTSSFRYKDRIVGNQANSEIIGWSEGGFYSAASSSVPTRIGYRNAQVDNNLTVGGTLAVTGNSTLTGTLTVNGSTFRVASAAGSGDMQSSGAAGQNADATLMKAGLARWKWRANNASESGSNAGSNLLLNSYDDAGSFLATVMEITRSTGSILLGSITPNASRTAAQIADATDSINTIGKFRGRIVEDLTNDRVMRATGSNATSAWKDLTGGNAVTPA